jgi:catechol 2,3-dioxygenase-like lactoylglutathione lyase family enzyme
MVIAVAGPFSAPTPEARASNLDAMNHAAVEVMRRGHIPMIGVNAALGVVELLEERDRYDAMMAISLALVERCDAILLIGESPGANRERDLLASQGKPVYDRLEDLPSPAAGAAGLSSFSRPVRSSSHKEAPVARALVPYVHVADVRRSIDFYARFGFAVANSFTPEKGTDPAWAWLTSGDANLMVTRASRPVDSTKQGVLFYAYCADVPAMHAALAAAGIPVGEIRTEFYAPHGEFRIEDPDGYVVMMTHG